MKIILLFVILVALAILAALAILGINPFATAAIFAVCSGISLFLGTLIVGLFTIMFGSPKLERVPKS